MSCSRSRWQGWKTAGRAAADRVVPAHAEDRGRPPANPATAQMQSRQPPSRLPPQESDIRRFENPLSEQPLHFNPLVLQSGLTPPPLSVKQPCTATGAQLGGQTPSAPLETEPQLKTCSSLACSSLHPLKAWSLRQTRRGSL